MTIEGVRGRLSKGEVARFFLVKISWKLGQEGGCKNNLIIFQTSYKYHPFLRLLRLLELERMG